MICRPIRYTFYRDDADVKMGENTEAKDKIDNNSSYSGKKRKSHLSYLRTQSDLPTAVTHLFRGKRYRSTLLHSDFESSDAESVSHIESLSSSGYNSVNTNVVSINNNTYSPCSPSTSSSTCRPSSSITISSGTRYTTSCAATSDHYSVTTNQSPQQSEGKPMIDSASICTYSNTATPSNTSNSTSTSSAAADQDYESRSSEEEEQSFQSTDDSEDDHDSGSAMESDSEIASVIDQSHLGAKMFGADLSTRDVLTIILSHTIKRDLNNEAVSDLLFMLRSFSEREVDPHRRSSFPRNVHQLKSRLLNDQFNIQRNTVYFCHGCSNTCTSDVCSVCETKNSCFIKLSVEDQIKLKFKGE